MASYALQNLVDEVKKLAKEQPDFIYIPPESKEAGGWRVCYYDKGNNCSGCIFGQAISRINSTFSFVKYNPDNNGNTNIRRLIEDNIDVTDEDRCLINWCTTVQNRQDKGYSWSEAVDIVFENDSVE